MPDEAELLGAVLAEPAEDAPRLAYADWLRQAGGESNAARAEFIRVQIEIEKLHGDNDDRRWPQLARRESELLGRWRAAWERPLRDLLKPSMLQPTRWLKARLFGQGGAWRYHRGFIEEIDTSASAFVEEDGVLFGHAPIRRVVISNATSSIGALASDSRLDGLYSLHLISDFELDEEMEGLLQAATLAGLKVVELRFPRIQSDAGDLFARLRGETDEGSQKIDELSEFRNWERASPRERDRLRELSRMPRFVQRLTEAEHFSHAELLRINEWIYVGDRLTEAGAWAVVKTFHDLENEEGLCRRLILFKTDKIKEGPFQALRASPHFHREV
jgi:uncharacterized protein (TIGR02996 family)